MSNSPPKGILLDLFPPLEWTEVGVQAALEIQEEADGFTEEEIRYLAKVIVYYMTLSPEQRAIVLS